MLYFTKGLLIQSLINYICSVFCLTFIIMNFADSHDYKSMYVIGGIGALICWFNIFFVMNIFESYMVFVKTISEIFTSITKFLLIFFMAVLAFANCFFILDRYTTLSDENLCGGERFEPIVGNSFSEAFRHIYKQTLGETDIRNYEYSYVPTVYLFLFIACTIILPIILLNVLI